MSEPTREEKLRTIRAARQLMENMLRQWAPDIQEFYANVDYLTHRKAPIQPQPLTPAQPETAEETARLQSLLSELKGAHNEL